MNLNHLALFRAVAETGSFTAAAKALSSDKAQLSRAVRSLEQSLGVVLLTRTTRSLTLTPAGEGLFAIVRGPLDALARAGTTVVDRATAPSGVVTLTTTPDLARVLVAPLLPGFRARFPEVSVRLRVGPSIEPFSDARLDLALRVGMAGDSDLRGRKLGELHAGFFASPRYLVARGTPDSPAALANHDTAWPHGTKKTSFGGAAPPAPSIACDDFAVVLEVVRTHGGVGVLPLHLARPHVLDGAIVRLFPTLMLGGAPLYLMARRERPLPTRVEALRAHLATHIRALLT